MARSNFEVQSKILMPASSREQFQIILKIIIPFH